MPFARLTRSLSPLLAAALLFTACNSDTVTTPAEVPIEQQTWAPSLGVTLTQFTKLTSGVYYLDSQVGTGTTVTGTPTVAVQYAGYLANGTKFDERTSAQGSVCFPLTGLITGWREGMQGMKVGGKRRLLIPPALGYGPGGNGPIPGNANLLFDITLTGTGCTA